MKIVEGLREMDEGWRGARVRDEERCESIAPSRGQLDVGERHMDEVGVELGVEDVSCDGVGFKVRKGG
jgi:hypothetical protein